MCLHIYLYVYLINITDVEYNSEHVKNISLNQNNTSVIP